jgi:hypothetical protein
LYGQSTTDRGTDMATQTSNPHPTETDDTVICAGCGHPVDALNDLASIPDPTDQTQMIVWHVDCEITR